METGTYYARVSYKPSQQSVNGLHEKKVVTRSVPEAGYQVSPKNLISVPRLRNVDATPGHKQSVTFKWRFLQPHDTTYIRVFHASTSKLVYQEVRSNLPPNTDLYFTWDGSVNQPNLGSFAENGTYLIKVLAEDAQRFPYVAKAVVRNTIDTEEYELQVLLDQLNQTIPSEKIRQMQTYLSDMLFYEGDITGQYNEEFLMSVIAYEATINKWSTQVALDVYKRGMSYLPENGVISDRLLGYAYADWSLGRDKYGSIYEILYTGDIIIVSEGVSAPAGTVIKGIEVLINAGRIEKNIITYTKGTKPLLLPASKVQEAIDRLGTNKIQHIINGSKNTDHQWEKLVPDKN